VKALNFFQFAFGKAIDGAITTRKVGPGIECDDPPRISGSPRWHEAHDSKRTNAQSRPVFQEQFGSFGSTGRCIKEFIRKIQREFPAERI
jgi:hypothetical protein